MDSDFTTRNVNEDIVNLYLDDYMFKAGMCTCSRCRADVQAYALNMLAPRYIVTVQGYVFSTMQSNTHQNHADIIASIAKGIQIVRERPNHDMV